MLSRAAEPERAAKRAADGAAKLRAGGEQFDGLDARALADELDALAAKGGALDGGGAALGDDDARRLVNLTMTAFNESRPPPPPPPPAKQDAGGGAAGAAADAKGKGRRKRKKKKAKSEL